MACKSSRVISARETLTGPIQHEQSIEFNE
jgi:hypothetical protein